MKLKLPTPPPWLSWLSIVSVLSGAGYFIYNRYEPPQPVLVFRYHKAVTVDTELAGGLAVRIVKGGEDLTKAGETITVYSVAAINVGRVALRASDFIPDAPPAIVISKGEVVSVDPAKDSFPSNLRVLAPPDKGTAASKSRLELRPCVLNPNDEARYQLIIRHSVEAVPEITVEGAYAGGRPILELETIASPENTLKGLPLVVNFLFAGVVGFFFGRTSRLLERERERFAALERDSQSALAEAREALRRSLESGAELLESKEKGADDPHG